MSSLGIPELLLLTVVIVLPNAFWVWMLVDCLKYERPNTTEKLIWIIVVLFGHFLGAVLYLYFRRTKRLAHPYEAPARQGIDVP